MPNKYHTFFEMTFDEVKELLFSDNESIIKNGVNVKASKDNPRLKTFFASGPKCRGCGIEGNKFLAQVQEYIFKSEKWEDYRTKGVIPKAHLNLWAIHDDMEVLMTSDHIIPKSLGGKNATKNRETLCEACNILKGNDPDWLTDLPRDENGNLIKREDRQTVVKK